MPVGGAAGAGAAFLDVLRLAARFLVDFFAGPLAVRFLVDFLAAGLRLAVFFFGDGFAAFFAARFLVAISCGSFRVSTQLVFLVYPPGAEVRGETSTQRKNSNAAVYNRVNLGGNPSAFKR